MTSSFHPYQCVSWKAFQERAEELLSSEDKWVFRGHTNAEWTLKTTLERACERFGVHGGDRAKVERRMIREFQRRLHHYTANLPGVDSSDEWMALMQHHGAPTRFLDFTYSAYVAAYFAFEAAEMGSQVAIWAVNTDWCARELQSRSKDLATQYLEYQQHRGAKPFGSIFMTSPPQKLALSVTPFRLNERLAYQRGVFLCPGDVTVRFMENLSAFAGSEDLKRKVLKFVMPTGDKGELRNDVLER